MTKNNTKRALLMSALSLLLCMSMLVGTTFAWFTDTDTTGVNTIVSGKLDVEIVDANGNEKTDTLKFLNKDGSPDILWEPNATFHTEQFAIKNNGNLWLKFKVQLNNTEVSYNKLNEVITFYLVDAATGAQVELSTMQDVELAPETRTGFYRIVGYMDKNAGNEYQGLTLDGVSITVYASQLDKENDAFGPEYDATAPYDGQVITVGTADEFVNAFANLKNGGIVALTNNIDMTGKAWTPVDNKSFTLDGNNYTIIGLNGGMSDHTGSGEITIKNVTFDGMVDNSTTNYAGLIGDADTCSYLNLNNVTVKNATITSAKYAAGLAAYTSGYGADWDGPVNASHNVYNCSVINSNITGNGSVGALIGHAGGNLATTTTISGIQVTGNAIKGEDAAHTGTLIGTSHVGEVNLTYAESSVQDGPIIGRFVPGTTGKLIVNGNEQAAFENTVKYTTVVKNDDISADEVKELLGNGSDGVVDFNGSTVVQKPGSGYALYYPKLPANGTIKNLNTDGSLYGLEMHGDITFENCSFAGQYAMNISDGNAVPGKVTFINCTIQGWMSFDANPVTSVEFINCTFENGQHTLFLNSYQDATFTNCTFDSAFGIDDELAGEQTWTFIGCTGLDENKINATGSHKTFTVVKK